MEANTAIGILRRLRVLGTVFVAFLVVSGTASCAGVSNPGQSGEVDLRSAARRSGEMCPRPVALGVYIEGALEEPAQIDEFAEMVGGQPPIVMWYQDWATAGIKEFNPAMMDAVIARGATPVVTWEPADYTLRREQPRFTLKTIISGDHDQHVRRWARDAASWGKPFYLRFAHEMNGDWYPWSPGVNGNGSAAEYVAAWRRVHGIFEQVGATNVRWVWNPELTSPGRPSYTSLYPGDEYVDWVAIDVYNWGTSQPEWSSWQTLPEMFGASYKEMISLTDKPMMVGEMASAESGGDKANWIRRTFLDDLPRYPRIQAVIWFHSNKEAEADWRVNSSEASLKAYREVAATLLYRGRLP